MLGKVHHIAIIASDYDKAKDFYVNRLELPLISEVWREDRQDRILTLRAGATQIELFVVKNAPRRVTRPEALGLRHLAFHVEDIHRAVAWLQQKGIETEPVRLDPYTNSHMTFFRDPDGLPLEIHE